LLCFATHILPIGGAPYSSGGGLRDGIETSLRMIISLSGYVQALIDLIQNITQHPDGKPDDCNAAGKKPLSGYAPCCRTDYKSNVEFFSL
jgi:hypothetical protein